MMRLFFGIPLDPSSTLALVRLQQELSTSYDQLFRWIPEANLHCTVEFLGKHDETTLPKLSEIAQNIAERHSPETLVVTSLECFPEHRSPRVICAHLEGTSGTLLRAQAALRESLQAAGYEVEDREFHPHVTLARSRKRRKVPHSVRTAIVNHPVPDISIYFSSLFLYESVPTDDGVAYQVVHSVKLG